MLMTIFYVLGAGYLIASIIVFIFAVKSAPLMDEEGRIIDKKKMLR